jgi:hypothetical protein
LGGRPAPGLRTYFLSAGRSRIGISGSTLCQKSSVTTHESARFFVAKVSPYTASTTALGDSLLFTDKFLTAFLPHSSAMGLQIRQKLSSLGPIFASTLQVRQPPSTTRRGNNARRVL